MSVNLISKIEEKLGNAEFLTQTDLINSGLFKSSYSARNFIKDGKIPSLRVSQNHHIFLKEDILEWLKSQYQHKKENKQ